MMLDGVPTGEDRATMTETQAYVGSRKPAEAGADLAALLVATGAGDGSAFQRLYDLTAPRLFALALMLLRDRALAEEALQEAFVDAWRGADTFRPERGDAVGWLATVLRNRALRIRSRTPPRGSTEVSDDLPDEAPDALARLEALADRSAVRRCLRTLADLERRVLLLAFYRGQSHADVARTMCTPLGTVKSRIRRSLVKMRNCLDEAH